MVYKAIPEAERGSGKGMRVRGQPGPQGEVNATCVPQSKALSQNQSFLLNPRS